jgi:hypothetical protein
MARKDINQIAFDVVQKATGEVEAKPESAKATAGRKGGLKGGVVRAKTLSPERRIQIAKKAAKTRWVAKPPKVEVEDN